MPATWMRATRMWPVAALAAATLVVAGCGGTSDGGARGLADASPTATGCALTPGADCTGANLAGQDLSGKDLTGIVLRKADLSGAVLDQADLSGATLADAKLTNVRAKGATLTGVTATAADLTGADLTGAKLTGAQAGGATFVKAVLIDVDLTDADLKGADLADATATGLQPANPAFAKAKLCRTKLAGGVIDSRSCPCTDAGGATAGADAWLATMALGALNTSPRSTKPAQGQLLAVSSNTALFSLLGDAFGGDARTKFGLPKVTGPWAGVRTGVDGDGACLHWSVITEGIYPVWAPSVYPGEILFTAVQNQRMLLESLAGAKVSPLGALLGPDFAAFQIPAGWRGDQPDPYVGELRLFTASATLPKQFVASNGQQVARGNEALRSLVGDQLPKLVAPDGYVWAISQEGIYPS